MYVVYIRCLYIDGPRISGSSVPIQTSKLKYWWICVVRFELLPQNIIKMIKVRNFFTMAATKKLFVASLFVTKSEFLHDKRFFNYYKDVGRTN